MVKHLQAAVNKKGRHKRRPEGDDDQIALEFWEAALLELNGVGGVLLGETIAIGVIYSPRRMVCQVIIKNELDKRVADLVKFSQTFKVGSSSLHAYLLFVA